MCIRDRREPELARLGIRLHWHNASPQARPLAERVALEQILHNLVQNAADALANTAGPRQITLEGRADGAHYVLSLIHILK